VIIHNRHNFFIHHRLLCDTDSDSDSDRLYPRACPRVTINKLPDNVLLDIFVNFGDMARWRVDYYSAVDGERHSKDEDGWRTLVQVCKRWRSVVFASPHRLDLRLFCTNTRPVEKLLDIWPPLPISILASHPAGKSPLRGVTNLTAALKQRNRVWGIWIDGVPNSLLKDSVVMKPFPALSSLLLSSNDEKAPVLPDSFLGGSAPRLRTIWLRGIPFPGIGKLLLSTTNLVLLFLRDIPHSGYITPEAMVVGLSTLTRLEELRLQFRCPRSLADRESRHPPSLTRIVLPSLTRLWFKGDSEYLEDIMSRVDAPLLDSVNIMFFNQLLFDTPQLRHVIGRIGNFKALDRASIHFYDDDVAVEPCRTLSLRISCKPSDWQLSSLSRLYNAALYPLPTLKRLEVHDYRKYWEGNMENVQWLELLRLFPSLKDLVLSGILFQLVAPSLNELDEESITEVLPDLRNIILQDPQPSEPDNKAIERFVAIRQLLGSPVTVQHRDVKDLNH
jgi:hypothetical protein